jgi:hypothetical protein
VANAIITTYTMYFYIENEGIDDVNIRVSSPSSVDSVFVKNSGMLLCSTIFNSYEGSSLWLLLSSTIEGLARGLTKFKRGAFVTNA